MKKILLVLLVAVGVFLFVYGEYDDSPGAQGLGLLVVGLAAWKLKKMKVFLVTLGVFVLVMGGYQLWQGRVGEPVDYKDATYLIDNKSVTLQDGVATTAIPDSSAAVVTRYFGNELRYDLDGDSREDVVFLITQETGGSGTFFYVVAALNTTEGYKGSRDAYLLGDRVAPQATFLSPDPKHKDVIVVTYADRATGESFTDAPSVGKSVLLKFDPATMQFGIVAPDFEGESR